MYNNFPFECRTHYFFKGMDEQKCTTLATLKPQECGIDSTNARSGTATAAARAIAAGAQDGHLGASWGPWGMGLGWNLRRI